MLKLKNFRSWYNKSNFNLIYLLFLNEGKAPHYDIAYSSERDYVYSLTIIIYASRFSFNN